MKTENKTTKPQTQLQYVPNYFCQKGCPFVKNADISKDISKIEEVLVLKKIFSKTTYVSMYVPNLQFLV